MAVGGAIEQSEARLESLGQRAGRLP